METTSTTTTRKPTSAEAAKTLEARRAETRRGAKELEALEAERTEAATAFAADMSIGKRGKVAAADEKVREAKVTLEALAKREADAERAHAQTKRAEMRAELDALLTSADADALTKKLFQELVAPAIEFDRVFTARLERARAMCRSQRDTMQRARHLADDLAVELPRGCRDVVLDDVRILAGVAVSHDRETGGRAGAGVEHFLTPIGEPYVWEDGARRANPLADEEQILAASQFLKGVES